MIINKICYNRLYNMNFNRRGGGEESVQLGTSVVSLATWIFNTAAQTLRRILDSPDSKVSRSLCL